MQYAYSSFYRAEVVRRYKLVVGVGACAYVDSNGTCACDYHNCADYQCSMLTEESANEYRDF